MLVIPKQIVIIVTFVIWLIPRGGRTFRFFFSLLYLLLGSRQSVYGHFREIYAPRSTQTLKRFISALARTSEPGHDSLPATLLARLLRTNYLTEVTFDLGDGLLDGEKSVVYIDHPHFSYGESLERFVGASERPRD